MTGAWEFAENGLPNRLVGSRTHGGAMKADAESHSIALGEFGFLMFEWDVAADRISRPASLRELYGYPIEEIEPTMAWLRERIHPDDFARDRAHFWSETARRAPLIHGRYRVRHRDGHWVNVKSVGAPEYDDAGKLVRVVGCTMDMDETSILEEAHARLAAVVAHSHDAVFSIDMEGRILTWNAAAERLYGYGADEIVGQPLVTIVPEGHHAMSRRAMMDILGGETRVFQAVRRRRDSSLVSVEISGAPIHATSGSILGISTIHRDVTHARKIALADAHLSAVVGASRDAIVSLDPDGVVLSWNRGAEELFGWPAEKAIGQSISFIVPQDRMREHEQIMRRVTAGESSLSETIRVAREGNTIAVSASYTPFVDQGRHAGTAAIFRDIGDRIARESHIHVLLKELSHRSKNLLAIVQGIARQSAMRTADFPTFLESFTARLRALAHSHDLLVQENWHGADMHALIATQTGAFEIGPEAIHIEGERLLVRPEAAQNIGLSMHELASNALRYGALSTPEGRVDIAWNFVERPAGRTLRLTWREHGGPAARLPKRSGFGILVVTQITPRALGGEATLNVTDEGLTWELEVPASNLLAAAPDAAA
jgi:PAS domain S-box-containing protein